MIIVSQAGLFGPYAKTQEMEDRVRVWLVADVGPGADLPKQILGNYTIQDIPVPPDFDPATYAWVNGQLVKGAV